MGFRGLGFGGLGFRVERGREKTQQPEFGAYRLGLRGLREKVLELINLRDQAVTEPDRTEA